MLVADSLDSLPHSNKPVVLTIGNFDGVHLGHQALLGHLKETAKENQALAVALTYSNHPSSLFNPSHPTPLLCTIPHKIKLLEEAGLSLVILVPFSSEFAEQSAESFLLKLKKAASLKTLILGTDAHIGKNREGDKSTVAKLAESLGFNVEYFSDYLSHGERISSSRIRNEIAAGKLESAAELLGRPFSIFSNVIRGQGKGTAIGFPTANIGVKDLCLPPLGVYVVSVNHRGTLFKGIANLGIAPTMRNEKVPVLEVHLFDHQHHLYGESVEVIFHKFIRPEKRFDSQHALSAQIAMDIVQARMIHSQLQYGS